MLILCSTPALQLERTGRALSASALSDSREEMLSIVLW